VTRFFAGLDLLLPGVVPVSQWPLSGQVDASVGALADYCAISQTLTGPRSRRLIV
jgi:hypothetical protein